MVPSSQIIVLIYQGSGSITSISIQTIDHNIPDFTEPERPNLTLLTLFFLSLIALLMNGYLL
ncbi:hypothetical protein SAMN05444487_1168 [Marininema mesophilum]|uniref:Uncharacterized protein n=1 Tax=Marininema mesophilum TaxID=1048340 RepID=A0A1H3B9X3_9BACL|nr:hypothetical protein SAMN05444487_1168 [Marininema mesophilum]